MTRQTLVLVCLVGVAGCTTRADIEQVPIGSEVEVTRQDGGVVRGTLAAKSDTTVEVTVDHVARVVPRDQITGLQVVGPAAPAPATTADVKPSEPAVPTFAEVTLPVGTRLSVRLESPVGSDSSRVGDPIEATLTRALLVDGVEVVPAGSTIRGEVVAARPSGKVKGRASIALRFSSLAGGPGGEPYAIAARVSRTAPATKRNDAAKIGIPAAGGAIIGGLLGGRKGAVVGTAVGGSAGTAVVLSTPGRQVRLARGAVLSPRLERSLNVRVPVAPPSLP